MTRTRGLWLRRALFAAGLAFAISNLPACHTITTYPEQPAMTAPPAPTTLTISVRAAVDLEALQALCFPKAGLFTYGCAFLSGQLCIVYVLMPRDFNDTPKLALLGHEVLHCLGARHG